MSMLWYAKTIAAVICILSTFVCSIYLIALILYNYWDLLIISIGCFILGFHFYGEIRYEYFQKHKIKENEME